MEEEPIVLSAKDSEAFNELEKDRQAAETTLKIALDHHDNAQSRVAESHKKLWDHIRETYGLSWEKEYVCKYSPIYRRRVVREGDDSEEDF